MGVKKKQIERIKITKKETKVLEDLLFNFTGINSTLIFKLA